MSLPTFSIAAFVAFGAFGCNSSSSSSSGSAPPSAPAPEEEIVVATPSAQVAGSYLTVACSADTSASVLKDEAAAADVTACLLKTADGAPAVLASVSIEVVKKDGTRFTPAVVAKEIESPWHAAVRLDPADRAETDRFEIVYAEPGKPVAATATSNFTFDWKNDPAFAIVLVAIDEQLALARPPRALPFDAEGLIATATAFGTPFHFAFVTEELYTGNFGGIEGADAICTAAGARFATNRTWFAALSTASVNARDRQPIDHPVTNFVGGLPYFEGSFFEQPLEDNLTFTQLGYDVRWSIAGVTPPRINGLVWTGSDDKGRFNGSSCSDWSSDDATTSGTVGLMDSIEKKQSWVSRKAQNCSSRARLLCVSSVAATPIAVPKMPDGTDPAPSRKLRSCAKTDPRDTVPPPTDEAIVPGIRAVGTIDGENARIFCPELPGSSHLRTATFGAHSGYSITCSAVDPPRQLDLSFFGFEVGKLFYVQAPWEGSASNVSAHLRLGEKEFLHAPGPIARDRLDRLSGIIYGITDGRVRGCVEGFFRKSDTTSAGFFRAVFDLGAPNP